MTPCQVRSQNEVFDWTIPDQGKDGVVEAAVVEDLGAEEEVSELDEGAEDDEEHDEEADHVSGAPAEGPGQLRHGLDTASLHMCAAAACTGQHVCMYPVSCLVGRGHWSFRYTLESNELIGIRYF